MRVCSAGSSWEREHLLFRDYRLAYTEGKTGFVLDTLEDAQEWARAGGRTSSGR